MSKKRVKVLVAQFRAATGGRTPSRGELRRIKKNSLLPRAERVPYQEIPKGFGAAWLQYMEVRVAPSSAAPSSGGVQTVDVR